jgi:hypothetical protein
MTSWQINKVPDEFPLWKLSRSYDLPIFVYNQEVADSFHELINLGQATGTRDQMIEKLRPAIEEMFSKKGTNP